MSRQLGALIAVIDYTGMNAEEFHDWYDLEHFPERVVIPGVIKAQRWLSGKGDQRISVAIYDTDDVSVLKGPGFQAVTGANWSPWTHRIHKVTRSRRRFEATQLLPGEAVAPEGAAAMLFFAMNVDPAHEAEFNRWYDTEHLPLLAAVPGVITARRYCATASDPKYIAMYYLESRDVVKSDGWQAAVSTPWTQAILPHTSDLLRLMCTPYRRAESAGTGAPPPIR